MDEDNDKKQIVNLIQSNLKKNCQILKDTYLTLMLIAIRKQQIYLLGGDIIPTVPQVAESMQNLHFSGLVTQNISQSYNS